MNNRPSGSGDRNSPEIVWLGREFGMAILTLSGGIAPNSCISFFILMVQTSSSVYWSGKSLSEVQRGSGVARSKVLVAFQLWLELTVAFQCWFVRMSSHKTACILMPPRQWMLPMKRYSFSLNTEPGQWERSAPGYLARSLRSVCTAASEAHTGPGVCAQSWGVRCSSLAVCWPCGVVSSKPDLFYLMLRPSKVQTEGGNSNTFY